MSEDRTLEPRQVRMHQGQGVEVEELLAQLPEGYFGLERGSPMGYALSCQRTQVGGVGNLVGREASARQVFLRQRSIGLFGEHPQEQAAQLSLVCRDGEEACALHIPSTIDVGRRESVQTQPARNGDAQIQGIRRGEGTAESIVETIGAQGIERSLGAFGYRSDVHTLPATQSHGPAVVRHTCDDVLARESPRPHIAVLHPAQVGIRLGGQ